MLLAKPQGISYLPPEDSIEMSKLDLNELFFDGGMLWDKDMLELSMKMHFSNLVDLTRLREDYGLILAHHKMIPFIERYVDLADKQRANSLDELAPIPIKECADRANKIRMTPNEATSIMLNGRSLSQKR